MATSFDDLYRALTGFIAENGVEIATRTMDVEKPGEFDGPTITINPVHDLGTRCYYLAHSFGSICQWSTDFADAQKVFERLRVAKEGGRSGSAFETAVQAWRRFEEVSSEHAVWTLAQIGHDSAIPGYTVFFRADIEAMTIFHQSGKEPRWPDFFADWKNRVARGEIRLAPFRPKPIPRFRPVRIEKQEVLQERD